MRKKKPFPRVEITWDDAHCSTGGTEDTHNGDPVVTESVGYLVKTTKKGYTIAQDRWPGDPGEYRIWSFVPKHMVTRIDVLEKKGP